MYIAGDTDAGTVSFLHIKALRYTDSPITTRRRPYYTMPPDNFRKNSSAFHNFSANSGKPVTLYADDKSLSPLTSKTQMK